MSVQAMSWVLESSMSTLGARLVLLAIANHASKDGDKAFPNLETIAREAKLSVRQVCNTILELETLGELTVTRGGGRGKHSTYTLPLFAKTQKVIHGINNYENISEKENTKTLKNATVNSEKCDSTIRKNHPEPSLTVPLSSPPVPTAEPFLLNGDEAPNHQNKKKAGDPRHVPFKKHLVKFWLHVNPEFTEYRWDAGDAGQLGSLLVKWTKLTLREFHGWLENYRDSEGVITTKTPKEFLPFIHRYAVEPLDEYGKPLKKKQAYGQP